jgi:hypothetical protein
MAMILDTRELPVRERMAAMAATLSTREVPSILTQGESPQIDAGHLVDHWDWGGDTHLTRIVGSGLTITRGAREIRAGAPERVGLGLQLGAHSLFEHRDLQQIVEPGELALTDGTSVSEATWGDSGEQFLDDGREAGSVGECAVHQHDGRCHVGHRVLLRESGNVIGVIGRSVRRA